MAKEYFTWNNDKIEHKSRKNLRNLSDKWISQTGFTVLYFDKMIIERTSHHVNTQKYDYKEDKTRKFRMIIGKQFCSCDNAVFESHIRVLCFPAKKPKHHKKNKDTTQKNTNGDVSPNFLVNIASMFFILITSLSSKKTSHQ